MLFAPASGLALTLLIAPPIAPGGFDPTTFDRGAAAGLDSGSDHDSGFRLDPRRDGAYVYRDLETGFRAVIHADGRVEYPPPAADLSLKLFGFDLLDRSRHAEASRTGPDLPKTVSPPRGTGDPTHDPGSYGAPPILVSFGGRMPGLGDLVLRKRKQQRNVVKRKFLSRTFELREQLRAQTERRNSRERIGALRAELDHIWFDSGVAIEVRKQRIFELWDDCVEAPRDPSRLSPTEHQQLEGALTSRRLIEGFVRQHARPGTDAAFTPSELRRLNAMRSSRQHFEPYRSLKAPRPPVNLLHMRPR